MRPLGLLSMALMIAAGLPQDLIAQTCSPLLPAHLYSTNGRPRSVALGDFNGDGRIDVVAGVEGIYGSTFLASVLLGNGDGTLQPGVAVGDGFGSNSAVVGDFNGDGRPDLAVAVFGGPSTLLGNGDGTFQADIVNSIGVLPYWMVTADFNLDGRLDLAASQYGGTVAILLGNGDGTFYHWPDLFVGGYDPAQVAAGDFNADGNPDLAAVNEYGEVSDWLGSGNGLFSSSNQYFVGGLPQSLAVGDFNGDGKSDLVTANYSTGEVNVLLGNGDGTFQAAINSDSNLTFGFGAISVAVADFDADGKSDLAVGQYGSPGLSVLMGNGDGTFGSPIDYGIGGAANLNALVVGDLNSDGKPDVVVASAEVANVVVLLGRGDPTSSCHPDLCVNVTCTASDQCHDAGVCNPYTGICSNPAKADGTVCSDGHACTEIETCQAGTCVPPPFSWSGVLQPINADNTSIFKLGNTIPVKFQLTGACSGDGGLVARIFLAQISNSVIGTELEASSTSAADSGNTFRYDAGADQYIFNLATKPLAVGTWQIRIDLGDGVLDRVVEVSLRK